MFENNPNFRFFFDGIPSGIPNHNFGPNNHIFDIDNGIIYYPINESNENSDHPRSLIENYFNSLDCDEISKETYLKKTEILDGDSIKETKLYSIDDVVNAKTGVFYVIENNEIKHLVPKNLLPAADRSSFLLEKSEFLHLFNI